MSKLSSSERFFIDMIALGMEFNGEIISQSHIEQLMGSGLKTDSIFLDNCTSWLNTVYNSPSFPKELVEDQIKKIYCGRESLLREAVLQWYQEIACPTLFQRLKKLVKG